MKPKEQKTVQQAQQLLSQNNASAAKDLLIKYVRKNKPGEYIKYFLSISHAILGEFNEALPPAENLVKNHASNIEYLKLLGGIYHGLLRYDEAIKTFNSALTINDKDFQTLANIANSYKETHQYEQAEANYKKSLTLQPNQPDALTNYGLLKQANVKLDEAIELHKKALQLVPQHANAMYNLAYALNEKGENETSLQVYYKVIETTPYHVRALCDIAHVLGKLKQSEKALPYLQRALEVAPDDEHVHLNLGITHRKMDNLDLAEASFNNVIRLHPKNQTAKYYLAIMKGDNSISSSPDDYVQELFDGY
ncbi:MAG: tetratricopeptide repeat protein, partial [Gammaproteobacteria bacterium]|nr:tetratricopeptide repeat protein [Gammaproteobacteria bacterium]